ncbi:MAG: MlaD family protein [Verrucomicrobiota bacterium]
MTQSRVEWKVGLFVFVTLVFLALLIMKFSKSSGFFVQSYELNLKTSNVGGIRPGASVLMAGVPIGDVRSLDLDPDGQTVTIRASILKKYKIYSDARFSIQQVGFLGDQIIGVLPGENREPILKDGDVVACQPPFDITAMARSTTGLLQKVDQVAQTLIQTMSRLQTNLLRDETLTNLVQSVANLRVASEGALDTIRDVDLLIQTNKQPFTVTMSNLHSFSIGLNEVVVDLHATIETNRAQLTGAINNIESATRHADKLIGELQQGKGLAGTILKDEALQQEFQATIHNLNVLSSNLTKHGLLWKPKVKKTNVVTRGIYTGKDPRR